MKLYLDENLPPRFRHQFDAQLFQVFTYQFMGWQGKKMDNYFLYWSKTTFVASSLPIN